MFESNTTIRVRYGETDRMGYAYYGNYAEYFEVGRVEALRELGVSYKKLEDNGILLPVSTFKVKYLLPIYYDELITICTRIKEIPGVRITFYYQIKNEKNEITTEAEVVLVFTSASTGKPCRPPDSFIAKLKPLLN